VSLYQRRGARAAENIISSRKESDKESSRASGGTGNQGFGVGRTVAVGISVKKGGADHQRGAKKEAVVKGAHTAKMVEGGRKDKHILVNKRLNDGSVSRCCVPLGKVVMRASSRNRSKRCITF
jgi:hypothetical protein